MRIASSQVNMSSNRFYTQMGVKSDRSNISNNAYSDVATKLYGNDVMLSLKDADVGAIFLGEQDSEFTLGDNMGNTTAVIRSSGIFLREGLMKSVM